MGINFNERLSEFDSVLPSNQVEVRHMPQELHVTLGSKILSGVEKKEEILDAVFNYFGAHFAQKYLGPAGATAMSATTNQGKEDADDDDDDSDSAKFGPDIDEDALINEKNDFEKHRSLFSKKLSPDRYLKAPLMHIAIKGSPDSRMDPSLYHYKPQLTPLNNKPQAKRTISELESQGVLGT